LQLMDYTLAPLLVFEEVVCPTIVVKINGFRFELPASWYILVTDEDTLQLDVVLVEDLPGKEFRAMVYGMDMAMVELGKIVVDDYYVEHKNVGPSLNKHQMLCHPISPKTWVTISSSDCYNKYLKNKAVGNII